MADAANQAPADAPDTHSDCGAHRPTCRDGQQLQPGHQHRRPHMQPSSSVPYETRCGTAVPRRHVQLGADTALVRNTLGARAARQDPGAVTVTQHL
jgi:hypothetical protein